MSHVVITAEDFVSVPYQPSLVSGMNSRIINDSGTTVVLNDFEYAALSSTAFSSGVLLDGGDLTGEGNVGTLVTKDDYTPTAATVDLFEVSGLVRVNEIFGVVTTAMDATATTLKLVFDATVTASVTDLSATATITSDPEGTLYSIVGVAATAMTESAGVYILPAAKLPAQGLILPAGVIQATGSAVNAGIIKWFVGYTPLEGEDSVITAA